MTAAMYGLIPYHRQHVSSLTIVPRMAKRASASQASWSGSSAGSYILLFFSFLICVPEKEREGEGEREREREKEKEALHGSPTPFQATWSREHG